MTQNAPPVLLKTVYGAKDVDLKEFDYFQSMVRQTLVDMAVEKAYLEQEVVNLRAVLRWTACAQDFQAGGKLEKEWHAAVSPLLKGAGGK